MYRRYMAEHFQNRQLLPAAFRFPGPSFNRGKYSAPEDVLHLDCCDGKKLQGGWGVLQCSSTDLPSPIEDQDKKRFEFEPVHKPVDCCYAHTELCCKVGGELVDEPSRKVRETFRVSLAQRMRVCLEAGLNTGPA